MSSSLGTEQRDEYYCYELTAAAHKLVTEFRPLSAGQQVFITADTDGVVLNPSVWLDDHL